MAAKCKSCKKSVYPMDPQINLDGSVFHKPCAKCADCGCQITISNFTKNESPDETVLLCKTHYFKRFREGGKHFHTISCYFRYLISFSLGQYLGGDKYQVKAERDIHAKERRRSFGGNAGPAVSHLRFFSILLSHFCFLGSFMCRLMLLLQLMPGNKNTTHKNNFSFLYFAVLLISLFH
jgi:hypothetical protein